MKRKSHWIVGLVVILLVVFIPLVIFWPRTQAASRDPWTMCPLMPRIRTTKTLSKGRLTRHRQ